ncbi:hypothetical protein LWI28_002913 [Acer negundo]|uniref:Uncharacterized protein n=1 Tax=Acer negundo TaxID=4023 RepID=A0AAD5JC07_ACENE|nr:hypothetical protein LWI28_002913 [Acer negundo]
MQTNKNLNLRLTAKINSIVFNINEARKDRTEGIVAILLSEPVHVAGMVKLHECNNYQDFAAEIDRVYSDFKGIARNPNPSLLDPMPGYEVLYRPAENDLPDDLDPSNQPWETFAAALDLITAAPI